MATEEYRKVTTTDDPIETTPVNPKSEYRMTVAERVIYLVGGILLTLLALRFLLSLLGANKGNGFADFIYTTSHPFVSPFFGLFNYDETFGKSRFEFETLVAIVVYAVLMLIVARLVTIGSRQPRP
ncbi:hypothetical protein BH09PAT4_BH09PAT4_02540 [soil metagenome]